MHGTSLKLLINDIVQSMGHTLIIAFDLNSEHWSLFYTNALRCHSSLYTLILLFVSCRFRWVNLGPTRWCSETYKGTYPTNIVVKYRPTLHRFTPKSCRHGCTSYVSITYSITKLASILYSIYPPQYIKNYERLSR